MTKDSLKKRIEQKCYSYYGFIKPVVIDEIMSLIQEYETEKWKELLKEREDDVIFNITTYVSDDPIVVFLKSKLGEV